MSDSRCWVGSHRLSGGSRQIEFDDEIIGVAPVLGAHQLQRGIVFKEGAAFDVEGGGARRHMQQGRLIGSELHGAEPLQGAERWITAAAQHFVQGLPHHFRIGQEAAGHRR